MGTNNSPFDISHLILLTSTLKTTLLVSEAGLNGQIRPIRRQDSDARVDIRKHTST